MAAFVASFRRGFGGGINHKIIRHRPQHRTCTNINIPLLGAYHCTHTRYYTSTTILNRQDDGYSSPQRNQFVGVFFATIATCVSSIAHCNNNAECAPTKRPPPTNTTTPVDNTSKKKIRGQRKLDLDNPWDVAFMLVSIVHHFSCRIFCHFFSHTPI